MSDLVMPTSHLIPVPEGPRSVDAGDLLEALVGMAEAGTGPAPRRADTILDGLAHGHLRTAPGGIVLGANPTAATLLDHVDPADLVGQQVLALVGDHDRTTVARALRGRGGGVARLAPVTFVTRSGDARDMDVAVAVAANGTGRVLFGPLDEDDDVRSAEHEVSWLFDHLPLVAYTCRVDDHWTCELVTPWVVDLVGFTVDRWVGDRDLWLGQVHPEDRERLLQARVEALEDVRPLSIDYRIRDVAGQVRWVHDRAWFELDQATPVRAHGTLTDVTRRHRSDAVLEQLCESVREQSRQLRAELRARSTLLQLLVHDARTPLVGAREWLDIALGNGSTVDEAVQHDMLMRARDDLGRLGRLLEAVADRHALLARAGSGFVRRVRLQDAARQVVDLLDLRDHDVVVEGDATACLDPFLVDRVLANLVDNACRHSPPGTAVVVRVGTADEGSWWVSVDDEGDGVPEPDRERVFAPMFRRGGDGTGMGLAIVRDLVEALGGRVWVEEAVGGGASFRLAVPGTSGRPGGAH